MRLCSSAIRVTHRAFPLSRRSLIQGGLSCRNSRMHTCARHRLRFGTAHSQRITIRGGEGDLCPALHQRSFMPKHYSVGESRSRVCAMTTSASTPVGEAVKGNLLAVKSHILLVEDDETCREAY